MAYSREAQFAKTHPREFLFGIFLADYVIVNFPDAEAGRLKNEVREEVTEWIAATFSDVVSPFTVSQMTAAELGAKSEIEHRTGVII